MFKFPIRTANSYVNVFQNLLLGPTHFPKLEAFADSYFRALHSRFTCICILFSSSCFSVEKLPEDAKLAKRRNKYKSTVVFVISENFIIVKNCNLQKCCFYKLGYYTLCAFIKFLRWKINGTCLEGFFQIVKLKRLFWHYLYI